MNFLNDTSMKYASVITNIFFLQLAIFYFISTDINRNIVFLTGYNLKLMLYNRIQGGAA